MKQNIEKNKLNNFIGGKMSVCKKVMLMTLMSVGILIMFGGCMFLTTKSEFVCDLRCGCNRIKFNPDFESGKVLVVMSRELSERNKVHDRTFFGDIGIVEIIDLTYRDDPESGYHPPNFRQILVLILNVECKRNILRIVEYLQSIPGIDSAEPNYYAWPGV